MNLKCYKSVILPLTIRNDPLGALAKIVRTMQDRKLKNYTFIFHPARLLVDGKPVVGVIGIYCELCCGGRLNRENGTFLIL